MKILHTSDWHVGKVLKGQSRLAEHIAVLAQVVEVARAEQPDLTDEEWIHGNAPDDVIRTISEGVAAKGMPGWGPILGAERVNQAAAYILTLQSE